MTGDGPALPPPTVPEPVPGSGAASAAEPSKPWWKRWWAIALGALLALFVVVGIFAPDEDDGAEVASPTSNTSAVSEPSESTVETEPTSSEVATTSALTTSPETTSPPTTVVVTTTTSTTSTTTTTTSTTTTTTLPTFGPGTLIVPDEIPYGTYRTVGYWALLDNDLEIIENELITGDGLGLLVVAEGVPFVELDEAVPLEAFPMVPVLEANAAGNLLEGTYLVGVDIAPGRYRVESAGSRDAYAATLAIQPDGSRDIIDNELGPSIIIDIPANAWGFEFNGIITPL